MHGGHEMGRERRLFNRVLIMTVWISSYACTRIGNSSDTMEASMEIALCRYGYMTKGEESEDYIHDINIIIFEDGKTESMIWKEFYGNTSDGTITVSLINGHRYSFFAVANYGMALDPVRNREDLYKARLKLLNAREILQRMPMTAWAEDVIAEDGSMVRLELVRLAAKVSIDIDRSALNEDVSLRVTGARIGNSPAYAPLAGCNRIENRHGSMEKGFELNETDCSPLNTVDRDGVSGKADLYLLENMQGEFPVEIDDAGEKVFAEDDPMADRCSYIELEMEYRSDALISYDSNLIYRFYLGDGLDNLDVERNCHYHMTVTPVGDGLSGEGWRVDKSGIGPSTPFFTMYPGDYIEGHVGDVIRIWCEYYPRSASFNPGLEELEFDRERGIYDYEIDENGKGVILYLKSPGTGLVYMNAGAPVDQSGMAVITIYP